MLFFLALIIYLQKIVDSDWSRAVQLRRNTSAESCKTSAESCNTSAEICNTSANYKSIQNDQNTP